MVCFCVFNICEITSITSQIVLTCTLTEPACNVRHFRSKPGISLLCFSSCKGLELLAAQSKTQDASCLPALKVSDIEPTIPITPVQISTAGTTQRVPCIISHSHIQCASVFVEEPSS